MQGGLIRGMQHFLSRLHPLSIKKCLAVLWMLASFLRCHSTTDIYLEPDCVGVSTRGGEREAQGVTKHRTQGGEMLPTLVVRLASFSVERRGSRVLLRSSWRVHCCCGRSTVHSRQFNSRQPSGLNKLAINQEMFSGSVDAGFVLALSFHHGDLEPV